jgi:predicted nuclease with TOPRIM domain
MTPQEKEALDKLEAQYDKLREEYDRLLSECETAPPSEIAALKAQTKDALDRANENLVVAQNKILGKADEKIRNLIDVTKDSQIKIDDAIKEIGNIKKALKVITDAVNAVSTVLQLL